MEGEGHTLSSGAALQLAQPGRPADKAHARVLARVADAQHWSQHAVLQDGGVQARHGVALNGVSVNKAQLVPGAEGVHPKGPALAWLHGLLPPAPHLKACRRHGRHELVLAHAGGVRHHALVGQHGELACRKENAQQVVVGLAAGVLASLLGAHLLADAGGRGRAVVAVGDVGARDVGQHHLEGLDGGRAGDAPDGLADALAVREVIEGLRALCGLHQRLQRRVVAVGEEDRTRLAARRADVADAVLLLGAAGALVAADDAVVVVVERARGHDARLFALALL